MAKTTIVFGVLLIVLGVAVYASITPHAPTSLIPAYFGAVLAVLGLLAEMPDAKRRMLVMHIAVTVGLLGFILPFARSIGGAVKLLRGLPVLRPLAVEESMAMALICLVYTALCVRSFIAARRSRAAA